MQMLPSDWSSHYTISATAPPRFFKVLNEHLQTTGYLNFKDLKEAIYGSL